MPRGLFGPPVVGAPWSAVSADLGNPRVGNRPPTPQPPPPAPGQGQQTPFLPRVPDPSDPTHANRLRRHTEILMDFFNSLVQQGIIVQEGPGQWTLKPP